MRMRYLAAFAAAAAMSLVAFAAEAQENVQVPPYIAQAVADPGRPAADVQRDDIRKPGYLLAWAGLKQGDKVVDFIMGGGYFTRVLAKAVGPQGHVWAFQPTEFIKFRPAYAEEQKAATSPYPNVTPITAPLVGVKLPDGLDMVITVDNYHDMHLKSFPADLAENVDKEIFRALKPGGIFIVADHIGPEAPDTPDKMHRIATAIIRKEVEAAGFTYVGESEMLRNYADPHTKSVFDPSIRGKTDQVLYKYMKPLH